MDERVKSEREADQRLREMPITDTIAESISIPFAELERRAKQGTAVWYVDPSASGPRYGFSNLLVQAPFVDCLAGWYPYEASDWDEIRKSRRFRVNQNTLADWARRRSKVYVYKRGSILYQCTIEFTGLPTEVEQEGGNSDDE